MRARRWALLGVLAALTAGPRAAAAQEWQVQASLVPSPPTIDGVLDEAFWSTIEPVTEFRQRTPVDGGSPSERTEVRIGYDAENLYFGFKFFDAEPGLIRRSILHRGGRIDKDDRVIIALDTYHDRRNAYIFEIGALGTQDDALISDESMTLDDWNWDGVYTSETTVTDEGWMLEVAIPFTTIRFADVPEPTMGIAFARTIRRKNEDVYWPHIGQEYRSGISQVSRYATLTGLQGLRRGRHVEVKPYAIAGAQRVTGNTEFVRESDAGVDVKYALTSNLTLDLTLNTDFAQVESDNVQINLTRFNLFFPEKREFFLERAGLFQFGAPRETELFFSRRVGLQGDIVGGGRLTGQVGKLSIGALSLRTNEYSDDFSSRPAAWNSVVRLKADVRPRTTLGGIATIYETSGGHNRATGVDFFTRFWSSSSLLLWAANIWDSEHREGDGSTASAQAELLLQNDRVMFELTRTKIGSAFRPALGFVPRPDQARWGGQLGYTQRFESSDFLRSARFFVRGNHITDIAGAKQSHFRRVDGALALESGERGNLELSERFERLTSPARISGRVLPVGDYTFRFISGSARTNDSRELSGGINWSFGDFWGGTRTRLGGGMTWKAGPHLTIGADYNWNDISLPVEGGDFTTKLLGVFVDAAVSRKLFANALIQWDDQSKELQTNIRIDWIHTPGSDLFLVIDTGYFTGDLLDPRVERWTRRTGVVKLTYLKAF